MRSKINSGGHSTDDAINDDDSTDVRIGFDEFVFFVKPLLGEMDPRKGCREAFAPYVDASGFVDIRKDLKKVMVALGQNVSNAELDSILNECETKKYGKMTFDEFLEMMGVDVVNVVCENYPLYQQASYSRENRILQIPVLFFFAIPAMFFTLNKRSTVPFPESFVPRSRDLWTANGGKTGTGVYEVPM